MNERKLYASALLKWGLDSQFGVLQEEAAELIVAISHYLRQRIDEEKLLEELVDIEIMLEQIKMCFDEDKIKEIKDEKLKRLEKRLED
ncbi:MAG: hypothetical protein ACP6IQ_02655 [Candidatus Njordarchaeia archaeon]